MDFHFVINLLIMFYGLVLKYEYQYVIFYKLWCNPFFWNSFFITFFLDICLEFVCIKWNCHYILLWKLDMSIKVVILWFTHMQCFYFNLCFTVAKSLLTPLLYYLLFMILQYSPAEKHLLAVVYLYLLSGTPHSLLCAGSL